jgi:hypothetical protein
MILFYNERFKKERTEKEKLIHELKTLQESSNLTAQEREQLTTRVADLENSLLTKEQQASQQIKQTETKYQKQIDTVSKERDTWQSRFSDATIRRAITDAAVSADAEDPTQLVLMFQGMTRLEEVKDETGKSTGEFITKMKFQGIDAEKKPITLDLPVAEAIMHMRENGLHKNLFKHSAKGGTGQSGQGTGKTGRDPSKMPNPDDYKSVEEFNTAYQEWRSKYELDGTPKKESK